MARKGGFHSEVHGLQRVLAEVVIRDLYWLDGDRQGLLGKMALKIVPAGYLQRTGTKKASNVRLKVDCLTRIAIRRVADRLYFAAVNTFL